MGLLLLAGAEEGSAELGRFSIENPSIDFIFEKIKKALSWAFGCRIAMTNEAEITRIRENNKVWGEMLLMDVQDFIPVENRDLDISAYDPLTPRQGMTIKHLPLRFQLSLMSRDQRPSKSAWYTATVGKTRLGQEFVLDKWLRPFASFVESESNIIRIPGRIFDSRSEDLAILELLFYIVIVDADEAARGTWIEAIELTSHLTPMNESLQLDKERIP